MTVFTVHANLDAYTQISMENLTEVERTWISTTKHGQKVLELYTDTCEVLSVGLSGRPEPDR